MDDEGFLDYPRMVRHALRDVVRQALLSIAENGFPGEHHFYLAFHTDHPGVELPGSLRDQYPDEMTIVLQNQFANLHVDGDGFQVDLRFGGKLTTVGVPFAALSSFADPSVPFGLVFEQQEPTDASAEAEASRADEASENEAEGSQASEPRAEGAEVISFDAFRKR